MRISFKKLFSGSFRWLFLTHGGWFLISVIIVMFSAPDYGVGIYLVGALIGTILYSEYHRDDLALGKRVREARQLRHKTP